MRLLAVVLVLATGLAGTTASAQRKPSRTERRDVIRLQLSRRQSWEDHQPFLEGVDRLLGGLYRKAERRNLPGQLRSVSPIQLTGSSVYGAAASARKGKIPRFDDIDLRMVGVTEDEVRAGILAEFPEAEGHITVEPAYLPGLIHMQADVGPRQLDISIYPNAKAYLAPHQRLSIAALKVNVGRDPRLLATLRGLVTGVQAREHRARNVLYDPAGTGLEDAEDGIVRSYDMAGMDSTRAPEALLHAAYWKGKTEDEISIDPRTEQDFRSMSQKQITSFFGSNDPEVARARRNYVFSILRVKAGRNPNAVLAFLRQTGALGKILPGMGDVARSPAAWQVTRLISHEAFLQTMRVSRKTDPRWGREIMLGALLSGLDSRQAADRALSPFTWLDGKDGSHDEFSRAHVLALQTKFMGVARRYQARLQGLEDAYSSEPQGQLHAHSEARRELETQVAKIVEGFAREMGMKPPIRTRHATRVLRGDARLDE